VLKTDEDGGWPCQHCDEVTESEESLEVHMASDHPGVEDIPEGWCDYDHEEHLWTPGDLECRRCGADLAEWSEEADE
jgi:hypothetical protein